MSQSPPMPTTPEQLLAKLDVLNIPYTLHHHRAIFTVEDGHDVEANIPGTHGRNMFLRDKKKQMFLLTVTNDTQVDLKKLRVLIGSDSLSFGSAERLFEFLGVYPGSVCPYAAVNDTTGAVKVILDAKMMQSEIINYHPLTNTMTISTAPQDLVKFLQSTGHDPLILDLTPAAPDNC